MGKNSASFFGFENPPFEDMNSNVRSLVGLVSMVSNSCGVTDETSWTRLQETSTRDSL
jgi:hypothetical protein